MKRLVGTLGVAMLIALMINGCGGQGEQTQKETGTTTASQLTGEIRVDGSSTVLPISEAVAEEFKKQHPQTDPKVGKSGTGGGFKKFANGEIDITGASRPIREDEDKLCREKGVEYIEIPVAYDALAVVVNKQNDWVDSLTVEELRKIWEPAAERKITSWKQVRAGFPDVPLRLFGAGSESGTFDFFTAAIVGKERSIRSDHTGSEDDNILVQGVTSNRGGLGYFGLAYYEQNKDTLKLIGVDEGKGKGAVLPSIETVVDGSYYLARPIFIYVNVKALERPEVAEFVKFYLQNAEKLTQEVGYVPLPANLYQLVMERLEKRVTGSAFGAHGTQVGVKLEDLYRLEQESEKGGN